MQFDLVKDWKKTRGANEEYLFSNIRMVDVSVTNLFTRQTFTFTDLKVKYKEGNKENQNPDNPRRQVYEHRPIATLRCGFLLVPTR